MRDRRETNPLFGPEPFKLGVFGYLHEGGGTITTVPERWQAVWDDIETLAVMADRGGLDFMLPYARWRGYLGDVWQRRESFDPLTHAAALAALTRRICLFSTIHTPIIHPIVAAKALMTIDHVSRGRCGVNVVCGWIPDDMAMFNLTPLPHDQRYAQGGEWTDILLKVMRADPEFDSDGYYPGKGIMGAPAAYEAPHPAIINAANSPDGRRFAAAKCDMLLTVFPTLEDGARQVRDMAAMVAEAGRSEVFAGTMATAYIVCRDTEAEAIKYHQHYGIDKADQKGSARYLKIKTGDSETARAQLEQMRVRWSAGMGGYPLIGTPEQIVEGLLKLKACGFVGTTIQFVNYMDELPYFLHRVYPLLRQAGLRL